jgi:hypothetical protein
VVTRERMRSDVSRRVTRWVALVAAASTIATGCESQAEPQQDHNSPVPVIYAVKFPGGQQGHARIEYQLPDGTMKHENVPLPWESDLLYFRYGDQIVVAAIATDVNGSVPLQCVAISDAKNPKGTTFGSSRTGECRARGKAGGHPQSLPT